MKITKRFFQILSGLVLAVSLLSAPAVADKATARDYFDAAAVAFTDKNYEEVIAQINNVLAISSGDMSDYYRRGHSYESLGQFDKAMEDYSKLIELDSNLEVGYLLRGILKTTHISPEEGLFDLDKVIELDPDNTHAYTYRGIANLKLFNYEEALLNFDKVVELDPKNTDALLNKSSALVKIKRYQDAIQAINHLLEINPQDAFA